MSQNQTHDTKDRIDTEITKADIAAAFHVCEACGTVSAHRGRCTCDVTTSMKNVVRRLAAAGRLLERDDDGRVWVKPPDAQPFDPGQRVWVSSVVDTRAFHRGRPADVCPTGARNQAHQYKALLLPFALAEGATPCMACYDTGVGTGPIEDADMLDFVDDAERAVDFCDQTGLVNARRWSVPGVRDALATLRKNGG